ncbi:hypothetical protein KC973_04015 [Candidatus Saccharibacteria bacterium]|nr:hypothetical protein [Candidatus Saccharibacteria bacterium]
MERNVTGIVLSRSGDNVHIGVVREGNVEGGLEERTVPRAALDAAGILVGSETGKPGRDEWFVALEGDDGSLSEFAPQALSHELEGVDVRAD